MDEKQTQFELLKTFHEQFAQNQNHHQNLFIKFLSAVLIVVAAYFIVYIKIDSSAYWHNIKYHPGTSEILSYAIWHLIGVYFIAQIIFIIMAFIIGNMGYNFRRDQKVNYKIRNEYIKEPNYAHFFGDKAFNTDRLNFKDYLPGFHLIFFWSLLTIELLLFFSIVIKAKSIPELCNCFSSVIYLVPIIITILIYPYYYYKFWKKVDD